MAQSYKTPNHVLVIRLSAMGDVAMTIPVLRALNNQFPNVRITVLTRPFFKPLFSQLENTDVFPIDIEARHKGVMGLWKLYRELKILKIDAVLDLHNVVRSNILKEFFRFSSIPFYQIDKGRAEKRALTALNDKIFKPLKTTHQRYIEVFNSANLAISLEQATFLSKEKLTTSVSDVVGKKSTKWIGIAPFAAFKGKEYPMHLMKEVIKELDNTNQYKILLFGGGQAEKRSLDLIEQTYINCINIAGRFTFKEELALISNLDLMLSMDSGNGHLAANYGLPTITIWGNTHPNAGFYPYGQHLENALLADRTEFPLIPTSIYGNKMPPGYEKAIETIKPQQVAEKIFNVLEKGQQVS